MWKRLPGRVYLQRSGYRTGCTPAVCRWESIWETDGVLVVGTGSVWIFPEKSERRPGGCLQPGDYILAVNGHSVTDNEEIVQMVKENECQPVALTIRRAKRWKRWK